MQYIHKNESTHSEMVPVRQNPIHRTVSLFICVRNALSTIVAHNIAQNRHDNFPSYPLDNHHCSDDVYLREGGCLSANLRCRSETCCRRPLKTGRKKVAKNRHLGTIAQLCRAISSQKAHVDNRKKIVKQQYVLHMSPQCGELRPTSG